MAPTRIGTLSPTDRQAVFSTASRLGLDPYELGALFHQESGFRPNVWGGAGGQYRGLIQFGPGARQEVGLPAKGMTIAEQLPYVESYFKQRGYQPGTGIAKAYATVLGGNPNVSLNAKDAFGTSVASALPRMQKGGALYKMAQATLGDPLTPQGQQQPQQQSAPPSPQAGNVYNFYVSGQSQDNNDFLRSFILKQGLFGSTPEVKSMIDPVAMLTQAATQTPNYLA